MDCVQLCFWLKPEQACTALSSFSSPSRPEWLAEFSLPGGSWWVMARCEHELQLIACIVVLHYYCYPLSFFSRVDYGTRYSRLVLGNLHKVFKHFAEDRQKTMIKCHTWPKFTLRRHHHPMCFGCSLEPLSPRRAPSGLALALASLRLPCTGRD